MKYLPSFCVLILLGPAAAAAQRAQKPAIPPGQPATVPVQTETLKPKATVLPPPSRLASEPGYLEPAQATALANKIWQSEARARDLLSQANPEAWNISSGSRAGYRMTFAELSKRLDEMENARQQFGVEPNSTYKVFAAYAAIANVLPPLARVAQAVSDLQDRSLGSEFRQAWNDLLTQQEALEPYLKFLLLHHDEIVEQYESDVARCQGQLTVAVRGQRQPVTNRRSIAPAFKGRRVKKAKQPEKKPKP